jgi:peptidoglycan/LPS O-acetylase OafA/YrhL
MHVIGALLIITSVSESFILQSFFHNSVSRYLGRISFGLYLCHGPICHMIGYALVPRLWAYTNGPTQAPIPSSATLPAGLVLSPEKIKEQAKRSYSGGTPLGFEMGFLFGGLVVVPAAVWAADLFTRYIDEPIVRLARGVEEKVGLDDS